MSYNEFVTMKKITTAIVIVCTAIALNPVAGFVLYAMRDGIALGIEQSLNDVSFWSVMLYVINIFVMVADIAVVAKIGSLGNTTKEQYQKFSENLSR
jgi:hypothetical protein